MVTQTACLNILMDVFFDNKHVSMDFIYLYFLFSDSYQKHWTPIYAHFTLCPMTKAFRMWCGFLLIMIFGLPTTTTMKPKPFSLLALSLWWEF